MSNRPKATLILHPHFTLPGGAGRVALEVGRELAKSRKVFVLAQTILPKYEKDYPELTFCSLEGPTTGSMKYWGLLPYWVLRTHKEISRLNKYYQLTILNSVFPAQWTGLLYTAWHPQVKSTWFCQEPSAFIHSKAWRNAIVSRPMRLAATVLQPILSSIDRYLVRFASTIFVNSYFSQKAVYAVYGRTGLVAYPGVEAVPEVLPISKREPVMVSVGRLTKFKRFDLVVKAVAQLPTMRLTIVGDGEERENLKDLIDSLGAKKRIEIRSNVDNAELNHIYGSSRYFVLASENEPFGMVVLEAMAHGMVVIADNSGGPAELISNRQSGVLCNPLTVESLAATLEEVEANPHLAQTLANGAVAATKNSFTWQHAAAVIAKEV